jgi:hypothetical protein
MRRIAFRREAGFGSTDFSLCAFRLERKTKSHRLKPVLLDQAEPALWLHPMEWVNGYNKIAARNSRK